MRRLIVPILALLALIPTSGAAATHSVAMSDHIFWSTVAMSSTITLRVGDTVTWENRGNVTHNARAEDGSWASPNLVPGGTYSRTFTTPGEQRYVCSLHLVEEMFGTVIVEGPSGHRLFVPTTTR